MKKVSNIAITRAKLGMRRALKDISPSPEVEWAVKQAGKYAALGLAREAKKQKRRDRVLPLFR